MIQPGPVDLMTSKLNGRSALLLRADDARLAISSALENERRSALGQFMTPSSVAAFMAGMFELREANVRLLDAGAGAGSLTAAFVAEACHRPKHAQSIEATAFEIEPAMIPHLRHMLRACEREAAVAATRFAGQLVQRDFVEFASGVLDSGLFGTRSMRGFTAAILNPPYCKIRSDSRERALLRAVGIETSNLYTAFVGLAIRLLEPGGELVAITPRSFCNGPYFKPFRSLLLREMTLLRIHVFEARDRAFADDDVLQENVIFHAKKGVERGTVVLSTSASPEGAVTTRVVPYGSVVNPADPQAFIHFAASEDDERVAARIQAMPCQLADLGLQVSTGRVVDFRSREHLRQDPGPLTVPLIYPAHFAGGFVAWPRVGGRKPNAIADVAATANLMVANETYVLTKRFTSKEERRRVVAAVYDPARLPRRTRRVGFENHLNYFHANGRGLPTLLARGLAAYLNSSAIDRFFRQFNGHTQVNAADLRSLHYPSRDQLTRIGRRIGRQALDQEGLDRIVEGLAPPVPNSSAR